MELIDTHCHLDVEEFDHDRDQVLLRCRNNGVNRIVVPAIDREGWDKLLMLCSRSDYTLYPALGLHPLFVEKHRDEDIGELEKRLKTESVIAIGEIGLDFFVKTLDKDRQQYIFEQQLKLASQFDLPVLLHVRKAHDQILSTLKKIPVRGGIAHAFNGSIQQAEQYLKMGFKLGFGGMLTFERSNHLRKLAGELPLEAIVLETDAPDMTVQSHKGERNSPEYLLECLHELSRIRGIPPEEVACVTTLNAKQVLGITVQ